MLATRNGLEPSTSSVTGWRANRLHHRAKNGTNYTIGFDICKGVSVKFLYPHKKPRHFRVWDVLATRNGLEPSTSSVTGWRANRLHHRAKNEVNYSRRFSICQHENESFFKMSHIYSNSLRSFSKARFSILDT